MEFTWDPSGKWHLANNKAHIYLKTQEGEQAIDRLSPSKDSRIFIVWITPDRTCHKQKNTFAKQPLHGTIVSGQGTSGKETHGSTSRP